MTSLYTETQPPTRLITCKRMKTKLMTQPSSLLADGSLQLHAPHSWSDLTQEQLRYVLFLLTQGWSEWQVRTYLFARFCGIKVLKEKKTDGSARL